MKPVIDRSGEKKVRPDELSNQNQQIERTASKVYQKSLTGYARLKNYLRLIALL
jgi:hypothetical protein